jgi:hypothetical protein
MRFTALLPPPPTPITSIRADWLGTMPAPFVVVVVLALRPSDAISMEGPKPLVLRSIMSLIRAIRCRIQHTFAGAPGAGNRLSPFAR